MPAPLLTLDAALDRLSGLCPEGRKTERVALACAAGRISASPLTALRDNPPFDAAALDGHAVRAGDSGAHARRIVSVRAAGDTQAPTLGPNEAMTIFTGAPMPAGADAVLPFEQAREEAGQVSALEPPRAGLHVRRRGEDFATGDLLIERGRRLGPRDIGLLVAAGHGEVEVFRRPRVAVFSSGAELRPPGAALDAAAIHDVNRPALLAALAGLPVEVSDFGILDDNPDAIIATLREAAGTHDAVLASGGMSIGGADHLRRSLETLGRLDFWKLAIKPGKPLGIGRIGEATVVGLPGNPAAALILFLRVVRPLLLQLAGAAETAPPDRRVRAGFALDRKAGRREWLRVRVEDGEARRVEPDGSAMLRSLALAHGLVELSESTTRVAPGDALTYLPFEAYGL